MISIMGGNELVRGVHCLVASMHILQYYCSSDRFRVCQSLFRDAPKARICPAQHLIIISHFIVAKAVCLSLLEKYSGKLTQRYDQQLSTVARHQIFETRISTDFRLLPSSRPRASSMAIRTINLDYRDCLYTASRCRTLSCESITSQDGFHPPMLSLYSLLPPGLSFSAKDPKLMCQFTSLSLPLLLHLRRHALSEALPWVHRDIALLMLADEVDVGRGSGVLLASNLVSAGGRDSSLHMRRV